MKTIIEQKSATAGHPSIEELKLEQGTIECAGHTPLTSSKMSRLVQRDTIQGTLEDLERSQQDLDQEMRTSWEARLTLPALS